jgi:hypothetical protein
MRRAFRGTRYAIAATVVAALLVTAPPSQAVPPGIVTADAGPGGCSETYFATYIGCDLATIAPGVPQAVAPDLGESFYVLTGDGLFRVGTNADGSHVRTGQCFTVVATAGCTTLRGVASPQWMVEARDGSGLLIGSEYGGTAIASFVRDPLTGALSQPDGPLYCLAATPQVGCGALPAGLFSTAGERALTPDGASFYEAAGVGPTGWGVFGVNRDPATGAITAGDCVSSDGTDGGTGICVQGPPTGSPAGLAASNAGVYVAVRCAQAACPLVIELRRSGADHAIAPEPGLDACIGTGPGCRDQGPLTTPNYLQVLSSGDLALWSQSASPQPDSFVLTADPATGILTPPGGPTDCSCTLVSLPEFPGPLVYSHDGYAYGAGIAFAVDPSTGALSAVPGTPLTDALPPVTPEYGPAVTASNAIYVVAAGHVERYIREAPPDCHANLPVPWVFHDQVLYNSPATCWDRNVGEPTLSQTVVVQPAHGSVSWMYGGVIDPATFTYTPSPGYVGTDTFQVDEDDGTSVAHALITIYVEPNAKLVLVSLTGKGFTRIGTTNGEPVFAMDQSSPRATAVVTAETSHGVRVDGFQMSTVYNGMCIPSGHTTGSSITFLAAPPYVQVCALAPGNPILHIRFREREKVVGLFYRIRGKDVLLHVDLQPGGAGTVALYRRKHGRWVFTYRSRGSEPSVKMRKGHTRGTWAVVFTPSRTDLYLPVAALFRITRELTAVRTTAGLGGSLGAVLRKSHRG